MKKWWRQRIILFMPFSVPTVGFNCWYHQLLLWKSFPGKMSQLLEADFLECHLSKVFVWKAHFILWHITPWQLWAFSFSFTKSGENGLILGPEMDGRYCRHSQFLMSFYIKTLQIHNELIAFIFCCICRFLLLLLCACKPHGVQCQVQLNFHPLLTSSICVWITTKPQWTLGQLFWLCLCGFPTVFFLLWRKEGPCGAPHSESRQSEQGHTRSSRDLWWRWKAPFWSSPSDPTGTNMNRCKSITQKVKINLSFLLLLLFN